MRSLVATITAVALLSSPALARAAEDGFCDWSIDPQLEQLAELIEDADCLSRREHAPDPSVETAVSMTPVFRGPREFGQPSLVHTKSTVIYYGDGFLSEPAVPLTTTIVEQYQSFKGAVNAYKQA